MRATTTRLLSLACRHLVALAVALSGTLAIGGHAMAAGSATVATVATTVTADPKDQCGAPVSAVYTECAFYDSFDGKRLGKSWTVTTTPATGLTPAGNCLRGGNAFVRDGDLIVRSRVRDAVFECPKPDGSTFPTRLVGGQVSTRETFTHTYGRAEFRAAFDWHATHSHSALWMHPRNNSYGAWPRSGEIDIVERFHYAPRIAVQSLHYFDLSGAVDYVSGDRNPGESTIACNDVAMHRFQTYAVEWSPTTMDFYVGSRRCGSFSWAPDGLTAPAPFDQPFFHIVTQTAVELAFTEAPDTLRETRVAWVKVWTQPEEDVVER